MLKSNLFVIGMVGHRMPRQVMNDIGSRRINFPLVIPGDENRNSNPDPGELASLVFVWFQFFRVLLAVRSRHSTSSWHCGLLPPLAGSSCQSRSSSGRNRGPFCHQWTINSSPARSHGVYSPNHH